MTLEEQRAVVERGISRIGLACRCLDGAKADFQATGYEAAAIEASEVAEVVERVVELVLVAERDEPEKIEALMEANVGDIVPDKRLASIN